MIIDITALNQTPVRPNFRWLSYRDLLEKAPEKYPNKDLWENWASSWIALGFMCVSPLPRLEWSEYVYDIFQHLKVVKDDWKVPYEQKVQTISWLAQKYLQPPVM